MKFQWIALHIPTYIFDPKSLAKQLIAHIVLIRRPYTYAYIRVSMQSIYATMTTWKSSKKDSRQRTIQYLFIHSQSIVSINPINSLNANKHIGSCMHGYLQLPAKLDSPFFSDSRTFVIGIILFSQHPAPTNKYLSKVQRKKCMQSFVLGLDATLNTTWYLIISQSRSNLSVQKLDKIRSLHPRNLTIYLPLRYLMGGEDLQDKSLLTQVGIITSGNGLTRFYISYCHKPNRFSMRTQQASQNAQRRESVLKLLCMIWFKKSWCHHFAAPQ